MNIHICVKKKKLAIFRNENWNVDEFAANLFIIFFMFFFLALRTSNHQKFKKLINEVVDKYDLQIGRIYAQ